MMLTQEELAARLVKRVALICAFIVLTGAWLHAEYTVRVTMQVSATQVEGFSTGWAMCMGVLEGQVLQLRALVDSALVLGR